MINRNKFKSKLISLVLIGSALTACVQPTSIASVEPPPPQGPPLTTDTSAIESGLGIIFIRSFLKDEGDQIITEFNEGSEHTLSWSSGAKPTECGYDCVSTPYIDATRYLDQPNQWAAFLRVHLDFDLDLKNNPFDRKIRTNIVIRISCNGWQVGSGEIQVKTRSDPPYVLGEPGLIEDIVSFILPLNLSNYIDQSVAAMLGSGSLDVDNRRSSCTSLGIFSNLDINQPENFDTVFWDSPAPISVLDTPLQPASEQIVIRFESIERMNTLTLADPSGALFFDIYVNGQLIPVPISGSVPITPGNTLTLEDVSIIIPSTDLPDLQIILADSLGGSGWVMFNQEDDYGAGSHILGTFRTEVQPAVILPGSGLPGSNKPLSVSIHEFKLNFVIDYFQPVFENPN